MTKELEALKEIVDMGYLDVKGWQEDAVMLDDLNIIETALKDYEKLKEEKLLLSACRDLPNLYKKLKALEIIKTAEFSVEFDKSQNEWALYISNEEQCILITKGTGIVTYELLKDELL